MQSNTKEIKRFLEESGYNLTDLGFNSTLDYEYSYIVEEKEGLFHIIKPSMESVVKNDNSILKSMTLMINPKDIFTVTVLDPSFLFASTDPSTGVSLLRFRLGKDNLIVHLKVN